MNTTKAQLTILLNEKNAAVEAFKNYQQEYNKEHKVERRMLIDEIINLHKKGLTKEEIIKKGYNKHTVKTQLQLFIKGKRVAKTIVAKYIPKPVKK